MAPETLAAAQRVAQHGARSAMLAARALATDVSQDGQAMPEGEVLLPEGAVRLPAGAARPAVGASGPQQGQPA